MKGLSGTALAKTTSLAQPMPAESAVRCGGLPDDLPHETHGIHVDARARGGHVHRGTDAPCLREGRGEGGHELLVDARGALLDEGGEAADEIDTHRVSGLVHGAREVQDELPVGTLGDPGDGRHRHTPVDDGHTGLGGDGIRDGHQLARRRGHPADDILRRPAATQVDPQRHGADVQVVATDHPDALEDLVHAQRAAGHRRPSCMAWARCGAWPRRPSRGAPRSPCRSQRRRGPSLRRGRRSQPCRACPRPAP